MLDKSVAIAALARNCEENLPGNIVRIEELRRCFSSSSMFIYENNSTDRTKEILKDWQETCDSIYIQSEDIDETQYRSEQKEKRLYRGTSEGRIRKMCNCRNKLLDLIRCHGCFDYVIFVDIDIEWFSVDGVVKSIEKAPKDWGGLFSNCYVTYRCNGKSCNISEYYDTFAFLEYGRSPQEMNKNEINKISRYFLSRKIYRNVTLNEYYGCSSAFGGIGIYQWNAIKDLKYEVFTPDLWREKDSAQCEHIYFNSKIEGRCYIAKELLVCYFQIEKTFLEFVFVKNFPRLYSFLGLLKQLM